MDQKKTYTARDFARYHEGSMPAKEMYALEKAALEDPFLADALEGYIHTSSAEADLEELRAKMATKKIPRKPAPLMSIVRHGWWHVAAIFILIGIAGYFFFTMNPEEHSDVAKTSLEEDTPAIAQMKEQDSPLSNQPSEETTSTPERQVAIRKNDKQASLSESGDTKKPLSPVQIASEPTAAALFADSVQSEINSKAEIAHTPLAKMNRAAPARISAGDSILPGAFERQLLQSNTVDSLFLQVYNVHIPASSGLQPKNGIDQLRKELFEYRELVSSPAQTLYGTAEIEFTIDTTGKMQRISIEKSTCTGCKSAILRMMQEHTRWTGDTLKKGRLMIDFKIAGK